MKTLCFLLLSLGLYAADGPAIFYSKSFPGSLPPYVEITVTKSGQCEYKEAPDDPDPLAFQLAPGETGRIFELADKLDRFSRPLESNLKVAKTGIKTFRWQDGPKKNEVKFNYSTDLNAQQLLDWFERITETEAYYINLERAVKFDKLGVNQALLELEVSRDRNRLVAPRQFLTLLDRIVKNDSYLHMARVRAANLADIFRAGKSAQ